MSVSCSVVCNQGGILKHKNNELEKSTKSSQMNREKTNKKHNKSILRWKLSTHTEQDAS